jgi:guanine nucleotide-binding protein subunit alpha
MMEAMTLFESMANSSYFSRSEFVLLFSGMNLFEEKICAGMSRITDYFPDYTGGPREPVAVQKFFADRFRSLFREENRGLHIHYVNFTDTDILGKIMAAIQDTRVRNSLRELLK